MSKKNGIPLILPNHFPLLKTFCSKGWTGASLNWEKRNGVEMGYSNMSGRGLGEGKQRGRG